MNEKMLIIYSVLTYGMSCFFSIIGYVMCKKALEIDDIVLAGLWVLHTSLCGVIMCAKLIGWMSRSIEKEKEEVKQ